MDIVRIEPAPKWIRGTIGDRTVVDTRHAQLVWEHEYYPWWYVPTADVTDPSLPTTAIDELPDHVKVDWESVERWFEEDVEVFVHPRSPLGPRTAKDAKEHCLGLIIGVVCQRDGVEPLSQGELF